MNIDNVPPNYDNARIAKSNARVPGVSVTRTIDGLWVVAQGGDVHMSVSPLANKHYPLVDVDSLPDEYREAWMRG